LANIPPGYQLHIRSWENDADNCITKIISGLEESDVKFYIYFLRHFHSRYSNLKIGEGFGNQEVSNDSEITALRQAYLIHPPSTPSLCAEILFYLNGWTENKDCPYFVDDLIGIWCEGARYRVFGGASVYYLRGESWDVTENFTAKEVI